MIPLVVGAALSVCGLLTWTMAARSFVRGIRFGLESYIGSSNAGRGMAETILGFLGVTLGWLLVRKRMSRGLMQRMFFVALAIALVLGIIRGSSE